MSDALSFFGIASSGFGVGKFLMSALVLIVLVLGARVLYSRSFFLRREKKDDLPLPARAHARKMNKGDPCPYCTTGILELKLPQAGRKAGQHKRSFLACPNCSAAFRFK